MFIKICIYKLRKYYNISLQISQVNSISHAYCDKMKICACDIRKSARDLVVMNNAITFGLKLPWRLISMLFFASYIR